MTVVANAARDTKMEEVLTMISFWRVRKLKERVLVVKVLYTPRLSCAA